MSDAYNHRVRVGSVNAATADVVEHIGGLFRTPLLAREVTA